MPSSNLENLAGDGENDNSTNEEKSEIEEMLFN